jgi:hypothetical protein
MCRSELEGCLPAAKRSRTLRTMRHAQQRGDGGRREGRFRRHDARVCALELEGEAVLGRGEEQPIRRKTATGRPLCGSDPELLGWCGKRTGIAREEALRRILTIIGKQFNHGFGIGFAIPSLILLRSNESMASTRQSKISR